MLQDHPRDFAHTALSETRLEAFLADWPGGGEDEEGGSWLGRSHLRPTRALSRQQARELPAAPADSARGFCAGHEMISGSEDIKVSLVAHRAQQHSPFAPRGTA